MRSAPSLFVAFACVRTINDHAETTVSAFVTPIAARRIKKGSCVRLPKIQSIGITNTSTRRHGVVEPHDVDATRVQPSSAKASIPILSVSLVKSIVGSGVLALPAGVATMSSSPQMMLPAFILIAIFGAINAYFFSLIGRVCSTTGATGYREAWEKTVGRETSSLVAIVVMFKAAIGCLAYSMILADSVQSLAFTAGFAGVTRVEALVAVTAVALLPLCLLKDLTSLAPFSLLGVLGVAFTAFVMVLRYLDGSYADGGVFHNSLLVDIPIDAVEGNVSFGGGLVLACTLASAFVAHYNAPRFYSELKDNTVSRFDVVTMLSFALSALFFAAIAASGFLTFGEHCQGNILNSYSPYDPLASASRATIALSLILTYPLPFVGFRDVALDILEVPVDGRTDELVSVVSVVLLTVVTLCAFAVQDLALVLSVGGGTFSTAVSFVFPALMYQASLKDHDTSNDATLALGLMCVSVTIGVAGVYLALENAGIL